jgi:hypothetical protein
MSLSIVGSNRLRVSTCLLVVIIACIGAHTASAADAYVGRPYGVATLVLPLSEADGRMAAAKPFALFEKNGRVLYPTFTTSTVGEITSIFLNIPTGTPRSVTVRFLFRGDEPLDLTIFTPTMHQLHLEPQLPPQVIERRDERLARRFEIERSRAMTSWWRGYANEAAEQMKVSDYPPIVETYLTEMLGRRFGMAPTLAMQNQLRRQKSSPPQQSLDLLLGADKLRMAVMRETLSGRTGVGENTSVPLPPEIDWLPPRIPPVPAEVEIEPIASHVPEDCFYIRFGRFNNFLWLNHLMGDYGGDVARMAVLRGHNNDPNARLEKQMALEQSALSELMGETVIRDVAMIGHDLFMNEGAAFGMLFHARNSTLLAADINGQRRDTLAAEKENGCELTTVELAGEKVSFLSTPDNRIRSFYVVDGDFHLVTTSREVARSFVETKNGRTPLGATEQFRFARSEMPLSREDTVFVYMSSEFFQGLISPQYRIELRRRLESVTDMELLQIATLAAGAEGQPNETVEDLIRSGFLPTGFGKRPDGSGPILSNDMSLDSRRGARGTFLPIPDVAIEGITPREAQDYAEVVNYHAANWAEMDPLMIGVRRFALEGERMERVVIDARMAPFNTDSYGKIASLLGPPMETRIKKTPGDIVSIEAILSGGAFFRGVGTHHVYGGLQDTEPYGDLSNANLLTWLMIIRTAPYYFGAYPKPGLLDRLPGFLAPRPDEWGYARLIFGLWRREWNGFSTFSFHRSLLEWVTPRLAVVPAEDPAQVRVEIGDLSNAKITELSHFVAFSRALQTSQGNTRFLHMLMQQLHVRPEEAMNTAQRLLNVDLVCPLGGEYKTVRPAGQLTQWVSTAWADHSASVAEVPEGYENPLLSWFRGARADLIVHEARLMAHAEIDMKRKPRDAPQIKLPSFNLFGGGDKEKPNVGPEEVPKPPSGGPREF